MLISQRQKTITHQHQSSRCQGMTENVISEQVNVGIMWAYPKGFIYRGNRSPSKSESKYWHFQGKTLMAVQMFDLCLTCLWSMWDVACASMLWFLINPIMTSSTNHNHLLYFCVFRTSSFFFYIFNFIIESAHCFWTPWNASIVVLSFLPLNFPHLNNSHPRHKQIKGARPGWVKLIVCCPHLQKMLFLPPWI